MSFEAEKRSIRDAVARGATDVRVEAGTTTASQVLTPLERALAEIERLQRHIDLAFEDASAGDAHAARVHLTDARWGNV